MENLNLINGNNLAYIGDAYYELYIRTYLLKKGIHKAKELQEKAISYVSAKAHAKIFFKLKEELSLEELEYFKKGRNNFSKAHRKNMDIGEYATSSGLEALIGYLYLANKKERLEQLMQKIIRIVEEE